MFLHSIRRITMVGRDTMGIHNASVFARRVLSSAPKKVMTIAVVGRPNVGKSTLFNRLTHSKLAIVSNIPGTTRDRKEGKGALAGIPLSVIDTGGLDDRGQISTQIQLQVKASLQQADIILFLVDSREGLTSLDEHFGSWLRKETGKVVNQSEKQVKKDILVIANKAEGAHLSDKLLNTIADAVKLGLGEPIPISASHGDGLADLATALLKLARERNFEDGGSLSVESLKARKQKAARENAATLVLSQSRNTNERSTSIAPTTQLPNVNESSGQEPTRIAPTNPLLLSSTAVEPSEDEILEWEEAAKRNTEVETMQHIELEDRVIQMAVMGKPNVGKSTFINSLLKSERMIVGPTPGLTRDAIQIEWFFKDRQFMLVDTAGLTKISVDTRMFKDAEEMKRIARMESTGKYVERLPGVEFMDPEVDPSQFSSHISQLALQSALNALRFSQVVVLMVEGSQGNFATVDLQLARKCLEEGRALVVAANKADIIGSEGVSISKYENGVREHCEKFLSEFGAVPVVACTAIDGVGVHRVLSAVIRTHDAWSRRISTGILNKWLKDVMVTAPAPRQAGRKVNLKYMTQVKSRPPTFAVFCNAEEIPISFIRFLRAKLQTDMNLEGVPIRFIVRKSKGSEVKRELLMQGKKTKHGQGNLSARPVGPKRDDPNTLRKVRAARDIRRRRSTRVDRKRSSK